MICLGTLEQLLRHGLHALRETLQQDKELNINNTSIGIIGPAGEHEKGVSSNGSFRILEGNEIEVYLKTMVPKEDPSAVSAGQSLSASTTDDDVQMAE